MSTGSLNLCYNVSQILWLYDIGLSIKLTQCKYCHIKEEKCWIKTTVKNRMSNESLKRKRQYESLNNRIYTSISKIV